jgi:hypothetical protein
MLLHRKLHSLLHRLWPLLFFVALSVLMTWPLTRHLGDGLFGLGDALQQSWIFAWNAHALLTDPAAIWSPPIFYPYPNTLAFHDHLFLGLITVPLTWLSGEPLLGYNLLLLLSFALSGWAVFLLVRETLGDRLPRDAAGAVTWAAIIAGAAFAFCAYRFAHFPHFQLLQTFWMLFALLFLRRLLRPFDAGGGRPRDALLCGLFAALQAVSALYYAFFTALLLSGYALLWGATQLWLRLRRGGTLPWRQVGLLVVAALVGVLLALPLVIPYIRVYNTLGIVRSVRELDNWSAPLWAYLTVPQENLLYGRLGERVVGSGEMVLFPGLLLTLLALAGAVAAIRAIMLRRDTPWPTLDGLFWPLAGCTAFALSLGTGVRIERFDEPLPIPLPYTLLYSYVPGFGGLRVPSRWGMLVTLALALMAAMTLAWLLMRSGRRMRALVGTLVLAVILLEQAAPPAQLLAGSALTAAPEVYTWLGQPEQADIQAVLELPVPAVPRGAELHQVIMRQWYNRLHWRPLVASYSPIFPFGTSDLLRRAQDLPAPAIVSFLRLTGIDTLVIHRDAYSTGEADVLLAGLVALPDVRHRADVGSATVLSLLPDPRLTSIERAAGPGGSIWISGDERIPGVVTLALTRRLTARGYLLYGPGRTRFYEPLIPARPGQTFAAGILSDAEDPRTYGFKPTDLVWSAHGLALYRGDPELLASLPLAEAVPEQFHPRFPSSLTLQRLPNALRVGQRELTLTTDRSQSLDLELDLAALSPQQIQFASTQIDVPAGLSTLRLRLTDASPLSVVSSTDQLALLRLRLFRADDGIAELQTIPGMVATATSSFDGTTLEVRAWAGGGSGLRLEAQGAAAYDDRPIALFAGSQPLPPSGGEVRFQVRLPQAEAAWLEARQEAVDGRYIVYLKDAARPESPGAPVATFNLVNGRLTDLVLLTLPLTALP